MRERGQIRGFVASVKCSNPRLAELWSWYQLSDGDLVALFLAHRLEIAERIDRGAITEGQGQVETAQVMQRLMAQSQERQQSAASTAHSAAQAQAVAAAQARAAAQGQAAPIRCYYRRVTRCRCGHRHNERGFPPALRGLPATQQCRYLQPDGHDDNVLLGGAVVAHRPFSSTEPLSHIPPGASSFSIPKISLINGTAAHRRGFVPRILATTMLGSPGGFIGG